MCDFGRILWDDLMTDVKFNFKDENVLETDLNKEPWNNFVGLKMSTFIDVIVNWVTHYERKEIQNERS